MTHVRTSPFYPQNNGKLERWHQSAKRECLRPRCPLSLEEARRIVGEFVEHYNTRRLHSAIGYIAPANKLAGRETEIFAARDRKLEAARQVRQAKRAALSASVPACASASSGKLDNGAGRSNLILSGETEAGSAEEQLAKG